LKLINIFSFILFCFFSIFLPVSVLAERLPIFTDGALERIGPALGRPKMAEWLAEAPANTTFIALFEYNGNYNSYIWPAVPRGCRKTPTQCRTWAQWRAGLPAGIRAGQGLSAHEHLFNKYKAEMTRLRTFGFSFDITDYRQPYLRIYPSDYYWRWTSRSFNNKFDGVTDGVIPNRNNIRSIAQKNLVCAARVMFHKAFPNTRLPWDPYYASCNTKCNQCS